MRVAQKVYSVVVAVLLVGTLAAGHCVVCPSVSEQQEHGCCPQPKQSHCDQTPSESNDDCPGKTASPDDYYFKSGDELKTLASLVPAALPALAIAAPPVHSETRVVYVAPVQQSPPSLFLLNSTLLI